MEKIFIEPEIIKQAYQEVGDEGRELLKSLFPELKLSCLSVMERVKTFEDACRELGDKHPLVTQYMMISGAYKGEEESDDIIAYLKLRIVCAALNEGWEPQFTKDETLWVPWHSLWTERELNGKSDKWKADCHMIMIGDKYQSEYAGFASEDAYVIVGSRLCLKSEELANYCGEQFIDIWADFMLM